MPPGAAGAAGLVLAVVLGAPGPARAAGRYVEDILLSRSGGEATIQIDLGCPMRLASDLATDAGSVIELHLKPVDDCSRLAADALASEAYEPAGGALAGLAEVDYQSLGVGENVLVLHFDGRVDYRTAQRADLRSLEVIVRLGSADAAARVPDATPPAIVTRPSSPAAPVSAPPSAGAPTESAPAARSGRAPLSLHVAAPATTADYIVNLQSTRTAPAPGTLAALSVPGGTRAYVSDIDVDGMIWHRLRVGFFATEADAGEALAPLRARYPKAWIGRAEPDEVRAVGASGGSPAPLLETARAAGAAAGSAQPVGPAEAAAPVSPPLTLASPAGALPPATPAPTPAEPLTAARAAELFDQARNATLDGDFPHAIALYTQLLAAPPPRAADARELLGVAFEKSGRPEQAQAEYRAFLDRYPSAPGAPRVRQRLVGLVTAGEAAAASGAGGTAASGVATGSSARASAASPTPGAGLSGRGRPPRRGLAGAADIEGRTPRWNVDTGVSQYYERNVDQLDPASNEIVTLSALVSDFDLNVSRTGGKLTYGSRLSVDHFYDLMSPVQGSSLNGAGDRSRLYYAYFDVGASEGGWSLRFGRQSLHHWGVLGRFDGAHFAYNWAPNRSVHVTAGSPVESPFDSLSSSRRFQGVAVDFDKIGGAWNLSAFLNTQTIGPVEDRRAAGFEVAYLGDRRSLNTIVDYDLGYSKLNTVLALGTWRLRGRATLTALVDLQTSPFLTTRNALIGQAVTSVDELMQTYTEEQIRQLAIDRTAESKTVTLGISTPFGQRFQLNADVTSSQYGGTVASAGVPAVPDMGTQIFYSTSLVASGLFGGRDVSLLDLRYGQADTFTTDVATWDTRFAIGRSLRLDPRVSYSIWTARGDGRRRETLSPSLRLLMNLRRRYRLELEVGRNQITRTQSGDSVVTHGNYLNVGYRADF